MNRDYLPKTPEARLWHLAEECGEVIQACAKIGRFGAVASTKVILRGEIEDLEHAIAAVRADLK